MAYRSVPLTGFYPLYDGANDQVEAVAPVARAAFQRIIPRYQLSSSETRDTGLGPAFYEVPVYGPDGNARRMDTPRVSDVPAGAEESESMAVSGRLRPRTPAPLHSWQGTRVDIYA